MSGWRFVEQLRDDDHEALQIAAPFELDAHARRSPRRRATGRRRAPCSGWSARPARRAASRSRRRGRRSSSPPRRWPARPAIVALLEVRLRLRQHVARGAVLGLRVLRGLDGVRGAQRQLRGRDLLLRDQLLRQPLLLGLGLLLRARSSAREPLLLRLRGLARLEVLLQQRELLVLAGEILGEAGVLLLGLRLLPRQRLDAWP